MPSGFGIRAKENNDLIHVFDRHALQASLPSCQSPGERGWRAPQLTIERSDLPLMEGSKMFRPYEIINGRL